MQHQKMTGTLFVPGNCKTLNEAVDRVHGDDRLATIVLGKGEHQGCGDVRSAVRIVGRPDVPKENIVVLGAIGMSENCHLQHMTIRAAEYHGVYGDCSFTMEDVIVEQCGESGVLVHQNRCAFARLTNVEVRYCVRSGVTAHDGACVTLVGAKTRVHHNCTREKDDYETDYGFHLDDVVEDLEDVQCAWEYSRIQLVSPLTKEQVSYGNSGGGNWGISHPFGYSWLQSKHIKTMTEAEVATAAKKRIAGYEADDWDY
jgi:hypothetical protein